MLKPVTVRLDFDRLLDTLRRSVRRADVLMGVGLNAAEYHPAISHVLAPDGPFHQIRLVKEDLNDDEKAHVAQEFGKWVRANGLRELLEGFSIFLSQLYTAAFLMLRRQGKADDLMQCPPPRFERLGIGDQVEQLARAVAVPQHAIRIVRSLNQARNCYAHRLGVVGSLDADLGTKTFSLVWNALTIEVLEPDGNVIPEEELFGRVIENGGVVRARVVARERKFKVGDELVLEKREMKEICLYVINVGEQLFNEVVGMAKAAGVLKEATPQEFDQPKAI